MIDLDIFGRGEIKRLNYELKQCDFKRQEAENEAECLRRVTAAQSITVERLMKEVRAQDELIRQMQETEKKLFSMYNASEAARQELARKVRETRAGGPCGKDGEE